MLAFCCSRYTLLPLGWHCPCPASQEDEYDEDFGGAPSGPFLSGPWPLAKGKHRLMWTWMKVHAGFYEGSRDSAVIYSLTVRPHTNPFLSIDRSRGHRPILVSVLITPENTGQSLPW